MVASSPECKDFDNASILKWPSFLEKLRDLNTGCLPHFSSFWIFLTVVASIYPSQALSRLIQGDSPLPRSLRQELTKLGVLREQSVDQVVAVIQGR
jgi:hypothetical protein